ncbi:hypothetical protein HQ529_04315 [Candidatus Woesearchaeota archaeon]|nr:hypothetical protein [Candidatus Woesearchaeota archaeon]
MNIYIQDINEKGSEYYSKLAGGRDLRKSDLNDVSDNHPLILLGEYSIDAENTVKFYTPDPKAKKPTVIVAQESKLDKPVPNSRIILYNKPITSLSTEEFFSTLAIRAPELTGHLVSDINMEGLDGKVGGLLNEMQDNYKAAKAVVIPPSSMSTYLKYNSPTQ